MKKLRSNSALTGALLAVAIAWMASVVVAQRPSTAQKSARSGQFALALPGYQFWFPRDHASHPAYATEWWYYTGHLKSSEGRRFGYQLTFFRVALAPRINRASKWAARDVIVGHFTVTDIDRGRFYFNESSARAAAGMAGASDKSAHIWLQDWDLRFSEHGLAQSLRAKARSAGQGTGNAIFSLALKTVAAKRPTIHGTNGVSQKSEGRGQASHYYSFTRLRTNGTLRIGDQSFAVQGDSWFDHEFGSNQLGRNQTGWDWFSIQLADGRDLMLYQLRTRGGGTDRFSSGTVVEKDGRSRHLAVSQFEIAPLGTWASPRGTRYPAGWRINVPSERLSLNVQPQLADQELRTVVTGVNYWEGACAVTGSSSGSAYVELTGYDGTLAGKF